MKDNKGFSLIELIIVVGIMTVLCALIAPNLMKYLGTTKKKADDISREEISKIMYRACGQIGIKIKDIPYDTWIELKDGSELYNTSEKITNANELQSFGGYVALELQKVPKSKITGDYFQIKITKDEKGRYEVEVK